jgi:hypothetical protein
MGVGLQGGWLEGTKIKNTHENQVHFQGYFISRNIGIFYNH